MNENTKTAVLVVLAAVVAVGVWLTRPEAGDGPSAKIKGELLFPDFKSPLDATSLEVTKYNEKTGEASTFAVAQVKGVWSIPSHDNYPADAKDHLAAAAADLVDLKMLGPAGDGAADSAADYAEYGVLDPTDKAVKPGTRGVGTKIVMKGQDEKTLVSMIVGKADKDNPANHYVRRAGEDVVVVVPLSIDKLTADFGQWIEKDLLKLNGFDVREIYVEDYTVAENITATENPGVAQLQRTMRPRNRITLEYKDGTEKPWKMALDQIFRDKKWTPVPMAPDEELNVQRLNEMRTALDDLEIVDVARKPEGLSADLAASKAFLNNEEALMSLDRRGFYVNEVDGQWLLYSKEGEVRCLMKDGVEYVLRFGNLAGSNGSKAEDSENRYLFVTAEFNPSPVEKPTLTPLPELPKAAEPAKKDEPAAGADKDKKAKSEADEAKKPASEETKKPEAAKKPAEDDAKKADALKTERDRIEKENKRKQDEYDAQIAAGKKKVEGLNARFANWYYVISEATYKKIHLGRKDIVQKKPAKEGQPPADPHSPATFKQLDKDLGKP